MTLTGPLVLVRVYGYFDENKCRISRPNYINREFGQVALKYQVYSFDSLFMFE